MQPVTRNIGERQERNARRAPVYGNGGIFSDRFSAVVTVGVALPSKATYSRIGGSQLAQWAHCKGSAPLGGMVKAALRLAVPPLSGRHSLTRTP